MAADLRRGLKLLNGLSGTAADVTLIDEIKSVRDRAEAIRVYAKNAGLGLLFQNRATELTRFPHI